MSKILLAAVVAIILPATAQAQDRAYCTERPGLNTSPCVMASGRVSVETSIVDWTRNEDGGTRSDTVLIGNSFVRLGIGGRYEAQVGFTPYGHSRTRTPLGVSSADRVGDVSLRAKASLTDPDRGGPFAAAVIPYVSLPVGRTPIGSGDWATGALLPMTYSLSDKVGLAVTPEVDAAVDDDGDGRHLAYSSAAGVTYALTGSLTAAAEFQALRDRDPAGHVTQTKAAVWLTYLATPDTQFDVFGAAGLNHNTPDAQLYAGISHRF